MGSDGYFEAAYRMSKESDVLFEKLLGRRMKEHISLPEIKDENEKKMSPEQSFHHPLSTSSNSSANEKRWSFDFNMWHSVASVTVPTKLQEEIENETILLTHSHQQLRTEVELVYNLLSLSNDKEELAKTFLAMSSSPESCVAIRQSGCMPLLVQLIHNPEESKLVRHRARQALHNIVRYHPDDKQGSREMRVLKLIEYLMEYCNDSEHESSSVANGVSNGTSINNGRMRNAVGTDCSRGDTVVDKKLQDNHPGAIIAALMKLSFDEEHRHAMCQLGALQVIAKLIEKDHQVHNNSRVDDDDDDDNNSNDAGTPRQLHPECVTLRRYAGMSLTNLTFGDSRNKALLCSLKPFMSILISQLSSPNEDLCQVTASVLRNLSWRTDTVSKQTLRELGAVTALMNAAMRVKNESTLKAVLSALWNLSSHCNLNKIDICNVDGAVEYLVNMLVAYQAPSKTLLILENVGGILRNISNVIAVREDYREILRQNNCLQIFVNQLKSPSLTVVNNACGTLWNLSARNTTDQRTLWQLGAVPMLRSLTHSKHKMISIGSSAALKNLVSSRPEECDLFDRNSKGLPSLLARKRRALEQELDPSLAETCDNIEHVENWDSFTMSFSSSCHINSDNPNNANDDDNNNNNNSHNNNKNNDGSICSDTTFEMDVAPDAIGQCRPSSAIINLENGNSIFPSNDITDEKSQHDKRSSSVKKIDNNVNDKSYHHQQQSGKTTEIIIAEDNDEAYGGDYAETDLDQPTNYSLKYTEQQHDMVKTYYTEGTPHTFSTSTSMSDLRQVMTINSSVPETPPKDDHQQQQSCSPQSGGNTDSRSRPEMNAARTTTATTITKEPAKTVTFDTPMMFSRSSSLGSLSSYEQPDDRSSVVSDFSRLASGMISPSDLPDSPSQTVPPSPRPSIKQSPPVYCNGENAASAIVVADVVAAAAATTKDDSTNGIFEDSLKVFKDENTPLHFSTATSLSSLTFDDDIQHQQHHQNLAILPSLDEVVSSSEDVVVKSQPQSLVVETTTTAAISGGKTTLEKNLIDDNLLPESVIIDADDDEDLSLEEQRAMLDACIKSGILNTKKVEKRKSLNFRPFDEVKSNNNNKIRQYIKTTRLDDDDDDRSNKSSNRIIAASNKAKSSYSSPTGSIDDITVNFCTEDTPANISHAASNSDLSLLCPSEDSFLQDSILPLTSSCNDDVELLPLDEQKKLLNECIKAGLKTLNNSAAGNGSSTSRMIDHHHHHHHRNGTTDATTTSSKKHLQQVDNLPIHEQKSLLKKCIMAGINNVTTASGSSFPLSSSCSYNNNNQNNRNNNDGSSTTTLLNYSNDNTIIAQHQSAAAAAINVELPEDEQKSLLKQCIAMGIRNIKDVSCDLENIGPPSFLAEANLENSLTNVDSIISEVADDSPTLSIIDDVTIVDDGLLDGFEVGECLVSNRERYTPKQKRRQVKDRYSTYTINSSNKEDELASNRKLLDIKTDTGGSGGNIDGINVIKTIMEKPRKSFMIKERRALNRDRFKTRTLNEGDFNDLTAYESDKTNNSPFKYEEESTRPQSSSSAGTTGVSSISSIGSGMLQDRTENVVSTTTIILRNTNTNNNNSDNNIDSENANDYDDGDDGDAEEQTIVKAKVVKPLVVKSGVVANSSKIKSGSINSSSSSSSIPKPKSTAARPLSSPAATAATTRSKIPTKLPTPLQRQGTFTKDDNNDAAVVMSAAVAAKSPVKKSSAAMKLFNGGIDNNNNNSNGGSTNLLNRQDCTPRNNGGGLLVKNCRIRSSYNGGGADVRNNRWSISDNSINTVSSFKSSSNSNLHLTIGAAGSTAIPSVKASPPMAVPSSSPSSAMQQQPNKKEVTSKIAGLWKKSKSSKTTK